MLIYLVIILFLTHLVINDDKNKEMEKVKMSLNLSDLDKEYGTTKEVYELIIGKNSKGKDIVFEIAQAGSKYHEKVQRQYAKLLEQARRSPSTQRKYYIEIVAKSLLKNWRGLLDDKGKEVKCTFENKVEVLTKYKPLFVNVMEAASDLQNFQDIEDEMLDDEEIMTPEEAEKDTEKN